MKPTQQLHDAGQSLWLDNVTRQLLDDGTLEEYIREYSVTGLTSNPSIFDKAIESGAEYDEDIRRMKAGGASDEEVFFELALADLRRACDLFMPAHDRTDGVDGWASMEVSPLLAHDTAGSIEQAKTLYGRGQRPNLFIKIPGTPQGPPAIEECIVHGVPINVTLLFSTLQFLAAAEAYMRGLERRIEAGLDAPVPSVASLFISRWDKAVMERVPDELRDRLGIAVAKQAYRAYREMLDSERWLRLQSAGARPQRLLWASMGTKDPQAPDVLYVAALAAPLTISTIPDETLKAFADHGHVGEMLPVDGGDCEEVLAEFAEAGIDTHALAEELQQEGMEAFDRSWNELMQSIASKAERLTAAS
ncbi:MAG: transaldolase [Actinomycetota bacterium]